MAKRIAKREGARVRAGRKSVANRKKERTLVKIDGRCLSRRIEFTPRMVDYIRHRYEEVGDSPEIVARSVGVAKATIQRLVREQQWTRVVRGPRDLSRAEQLAAEARALAQKAEGGAVLLRGADFARAPQGDGEQAAGGEEATTPVDIDEQIERLLRLVSQEIGVYENLRATLKNEPEAPRAALKTAHNLGSLTSTLDDLRRMRAANKEPVHYAYDDSDDFPTDIDAFRDELARQIEAFMESRTDEECGLAPADPPGDETEA